MGCRVVALETWGPYGRGGPTASYSGNIWNLGIAPLIGFPLAWSKGTERSRVWRSDEAVIRTEADLAKWKGKLKGKIVLVTRPAN